MFATAGKPLAVTGLACVVLFTERYPIDEMAHVELRVKLCSRWAGPRLVVDQRMYERLLVATGYRYRHLGDATEAAAPRESWWREVKDVPLFVTTDPGQTAAPPAADADMR